jgi:hypothetical protein
MGLSTRLRLLYENGPAPIRNLGGIIVGNLPPEYAYGRSFTRWRELRNSASTAGATEIQALQLHELQRIWNAAAERVPYYKRLIAAGDAPRHIGRLRTCLVFHCCGKMTCIASETCYAIRLTRRMRTEL